MVSTMMDAKMVWLRTMNRARLSRQSTPISPHRQPARADSRCEQVDEGDDAGCDDGVARAEVDPAIATHYTVSAVYSCPPGLLSDPAGHIPKVLILATMAPATANVTRAQKAVNALSANRATFSIVL